MLLTGGLAWIGLKLQTKDEEPRLVVLMVHTVDSNVMRRLKTRGSLPRTFLPPTRGPEVLRISRRME